jgi:peptide/nickel transport system substrate-binding protein
MRTPPFNDVRMRYAIAHALDFDEIMAKATQGAEAAVKNVYIDGHWATNPNLVQPQYDKAKAEELLDAAGYPRGSDGNRLEIDLANIGSSPKMEIGELIKEQLKEVGIEVNIRVFEWSAYVDSIIEKSHEVPDAYQLSIMGGLQGPDPGFWELYLGTDSYRNIYGFSNSEVDELFKKVKETSNIEERKEYFYRIQEIVLEELPRLNIYGSTNHCVASNEWQGFFYELEDVGIWDYSTAWWVEGELPEEPVIVPDPTAELVPRIEIIEDIVTTQQESISSLSSEISSLTTEIESLKTASGTDVLTYVALLLGLVAIGVALYFSRQL